QARAYRFSSARTGFASFQRHRKNQRSDRAAGYPGIYGSQRHLVYLATMWKEVLDFDINGAKQEPRLGTEAQSQGEEQADSSWLVRDLVAGKTFHRPTGGYVAVVNVGMDENWLAHPFAMANLYAYGRLAWNANLSASQIAEEWTRLTFGNDPVVV